MLMQRLFGFNLSGLGVILAQRGCDPGCNNSQKNEFLRADKVAMNYTCAECPTSFCNAAQTRVKDYWSISMVALAIIGPQHFLAGP